MTELEKIKKEVLAHPTEREGFDHINLSKLSDDQREKAIDFLLGEIKEGDERLFDITKSLLGNNLEAKLQGELSKLSKSDHGYIYISYFLYSISKNSSYLEKIKDGIQYGDVDWGMRRSSLGRILRGLLSPEEYCQYCFRLLQSETSKQVIKTALIGVDNYIHSNREKILSPELEEIRKNLTLESGTRDVGIAKLQNLAVKNSLL